MTISCRCWRWAPGSDLWHPSITWSTRPDIILSPLRGDQCKAIFVIIPASVSRLEGNPLARLGWWRPCPPHLPRLLKHRGDARPAGRGWGAHVQLLPFLKTICFGHGMCVQRFSHIRWDTPTSLCCCLDWVESLGSPEWRCRRCYGVLGVDVFWTGHEFGEPDHSCILLQANILPSGCSTSTLPPFAFSALH